MHSLFCRIGVVTRLKKQILCDNPKCKECAYFREDNPKKPFIKINNGLESESLHPDIKNKWLRYNNEYKEKLDELKNKIDELESFLLEVNNLDAKKIPEDDIPLCQRFFCYSEDSQDEGDRGEIWNAHYKLFKELQKTLERLD